MEQGAALTRAAPLCNVSGGKRSESNLVNARQNRENSIEIFCLYRDKKSQLKVRRNCHEKCYRPFFALCTDRHLFG